MFGKRILRAAFLFLAIGVFGLISFFFYLENNALRVQIGKQSNQLIQQVDLIKSNQNAGLMVLVNNIIEQVDDELKQSSDSRLTDRTISIIAALCRKIKPYHYIQGDILSSKELSPERGQLLYSLASYKMDSVSWHKLLAKVDFSKSDLGGLDLTNFNLEGAMLKEANFKEAKMERINLARADLTEANLSFAKLNKSIFSNADLTSANFSWSEMKDTKIFNAKMSGANLKNTNLKRANLSHAFLTWSNLSGADLRNANLQNANLSEAILKRTNLNLAKLDSANLRRSKLYETNFEGTSMDHVLGLSEDWLENMEELNIIGQIGIRKKYLLTEDQTTSHYFRLKLIQK